MKKDQIEVIINHSSIDYASNGSNNTPVHEFKNGCSLIELRFQKMNLVLADIHVKLNQTKEKTVVEAIEILNTTKQIEDFRFNSHRKFFEIAYREENDKIIKYEIVHYFINTQQREGSYILFYYSKNIPPYLFEKRSIGNIRFSLIVSGDQRFGLYDKEEQRIHLDPIYNFGEFMVCGPEFGLGAFHMESFRILAIDSGVLNIYFGGSTSFPIKKYKAKKITFWPGDREGFDTLKVLPIWLHLEDGTKVALWNNGQVFE